MRSFRSWLPHTTGRRRLLYGALVVLVLAYVASFGLDEPIRRHIEAQMNADMKGYTARIRAVRFHPFGFAITLKDTTITQEKHPKPPVADFPRLDASVQWRSLIFGRLVADVKFDRPKIHVDRTHVEAEAKDKVPVKERGWQDALEDVYPLKINEFVIRNGEITYIEDAKSKPLHIDDVQFRANNIRNIRSKERTYPSEVHLTGRIFESGKLTFDGNADFMAEPYAGMKGALAIADVRLDPFRPVVEKYNLTLAKGRLSMNGDVEYSPKVATANVKQITIRDLDAAYVNRPARAAAAEQMRAKTAEAAKEVTNEPDVLLVVQKVTANGRVRFVNEAAKPDYTLELADAALDVRQISNQAKRPPTQGTLTGRFQGSGPAHATFTFRPYKKGPDFDLAVEVEDTDLTKLNDLFRAYGDFDVSAGKFSLYTQLKIHDNRIDGYIKPFFADMKVYDRNQDAQEGVFHQLYEGVIGGLAKLLENPSKDQVATNATISGPVDNPNTSTLQIVLRLIQNAFFRAILPGFEEQARANA
jgi:hypothetical protein